MRRQGNYIILMNIKRANVRHWNEEVDTKKPEQLASSHLLLNVKLQEQGEMKVLPVSTFPFEI
jgi:hypothetical protein